MWCRSCNSKSPLVSVQHHGLRCARCDGEIDWNPADSEGSRTKQGQPFPLFDATETLKSEDSSEQKLFRFDAAHVNRRTPHETPLPTKPTAPQPKSVAREGDSPRTTMAIGLFFAGQSLVVWSFFTANVMGLAAGMVIAIAAVGVGYLHLSPVRPGENRPQQDQESSAGQSQTLETLPARPAPIGRRSRTSVNGIASLD